MHIFCWLTVNLAQLKDKTETTEALIRKHLLADNAALVAHGKGDFGITDQYLV